MANLGRRLSALKGREGGKRLPAIWVICEPGENPETAIARHEAEQGSRLPGQGAVVWHVVDSCVPRGADSWVGRALCA